MPRQPQWWEHPMDMDADNEFPHLPTKLGKFTFWHIVYPGINMLLDGFDKLWDFCAWLVRLEKKDAEQ